MKTIMKIAKGTGKVIPALLTGILMPILIWVALGVALNRKLGEKKIKQTIKPATIDALARAGLFIQDEAARGKMVAEKITTQKPVLEIQEFLTKAGLTSCDETVTKPCWQILNCPPERRQACPTYIRRDMPHWVAKEHGK